MRHTRYAVPVMLGLVVLCGVGLGLAQAGPADDAVVTVNGKPILRATLVDRLEQMAGERVLADLIARALLLDACDKAGIAVTDADVAAEIAKLKQQAPDEQAWQQFLAQQGMTEPALHEFMAFQLKLRQLSQKDVPLTDEVLKQHFAENADVFGQPESVVISEIVVTDKQKAIALRQRLHRPGTDLATLARENSLAPSKAEGGRRPAEPLSALEPEGLRAAVAGLKLKEISQPIAIENLWWILRVEQRQPAAKANYEQVKEQVREHYLETHSRKVQEIIEELRAQAQIEIRDARYEKMKQLFGPQATPAVGGGQQ